MSRKRILYVVAGLIGLYALYELVSTAIEVVHYYFGPELNPGIVYVTYEDDPQTTATINYLCADPPEQAQVRWGYEDADPDNLPNLADGTATQLEFSPDGRYIVSTRLTGLDAGTVVYFSAKRPDESWGEVWSVRTLPDDDRPVRFVEGGDAGIYPRARKLMTAAGQYQPDFVAIGGDLAYANGEPANYWIWDWWLDMYTEAFTTPEGRLVPLVMSIGNHEVNDVVSDVQEERAPWFFGLFPQGGSARFARRISASAAIISLDSGYMESYEQQVDWLRENLERYAGTPYVFATYHVPLYPSHRPYDGGGSVAGRTHWMPLFEEYNISIGFEHHDHTFKRTKRMRGGEVDPDGILYLGDGAFGVNPRPITEENRWYLEKAEQRAHLWVIDIAPSVLTARAVDEAGVEFDEVEIAPRAIAAVAPAAS